MPLDVDGAGRSSTLTCLPRATLAPRRGRVPARKPCSPNSGWLVFSKVGGSGGSSPRRLQEILRGFGQGFPDTPPSPSRTPCRPSRAFQGRLSCERLCCSSCLLLPGARRLRYYGDPHKGFSSRRTASCYWNCIPAVFRSISEPDGQVSNQSGTRFLSR